MRAMVDPSRSSAPRARRSLSEFLLLALLPGVVATACVAETDNEAYTGTLDAASPCLAGEACGMECPAGQTAVCVVYGVCQCAASGPGTDGGLLPGDALPPPDPAGCVAPVPGELILNELMLDAEPDETEEYFEILNTSDHPVSLAGLALVSVPPGTPSGQLGGATAIARAGFEGGCLAPHSALAAFHARAANPIVLSSPAVLPVVWAASATGYPNADDFDFRLVAGVTVLDEFAGLLSTYAPGVSANREPDGMGPGVAPHDRVSESGLPGSPGRCANGGTFERSCRDTGGGEPDMGRPPPRDQGVLPRDQGAPPRDAGPVERDHGSPPRDMAPPPPPMDASLPPPPPVCAEEPPGRVVINEVYANPTESPEGPFEFLELINPTAQDVVLDGWQLFSSNGAGALVERLTFGVGVLPAGTLVAVYGNRPPDQWLWDPLPPAFPAIAHESFTLLNDANPLRVVLRDAGGLDIDAVEIPRAAQASGISANRCEDVRGATFSQHAELGVGAASPGACLNGGRFSNGCRP